MMELTLTTILLLALAIFRITRLIAYDTITEGLRSRFFEEMEEDSETYLIPTGFVGKLISCHWCVGFWVSVIVYLGYVLIPIIANHIIIIFALAGLASILQWVIRRD